VPLLFSAEERKEQVQSNVRRRRLERQQECHPSWQNFYHFLILSLFFLFLPKPSQVSSNLYQQLTPLFQFFFVFFQLSPANLGAKSFLRQKSFAAETCGRIFTSSLDIQT
jgi:hypothetical protein